MTDTEPKIDFAAIDYPSDRLTVKMIRMRIPHAFDVEPRAEWNIKDESRGRYHRMSMNDALAHFVDNERQLAEWAFKRALGQAVEESDYPGDRETTWETLSNEYIKFGLARGEHEAQQMLRSIESQAAAQARQLGGQLR